MGGLDGPAQVEQYRRYVFEGKQEARNGNLEESIRLFRQAFQIHPNEKLTENIKKLEDALASLALDQEEEEFVDVYQSGLMLYGEMYNKLFDHQREGVAFLYSLYRDGRKGGILADDMGLGKTIQIIAFLSGMFDAEHIRSVLLIVPTTLISNWTKEFTSWTPGLRVKVFHGTSKDERNRNLERIQRKHGVLLTTYKMLLKNWQQLSSFGGKEFVWDYVILDEAHKIKTPSTKTTKSVHKIPSNHRILLTGTPVQNNLKELWSLFDFACQGKLLGTMKTFKTEYENPITRARAKDATPGEKALGLKICENLMSIIKPYFLRRSKEELLKKVKPELTKNLPAFHSKDAAPEMPSLPRKNDFIVWVYLAPIQEEIYQKFLSLDHIKELLMTTRSPLAELDILKKLCDHPRLLSARACSQLGLEASGYTKLDSGENEADELLYWNIEHISDEILTKESGKLRFLVVLLERLQEEGHRTLVFSQTRKMLDIIERILTHRHFKLLRIDGRVTHLTEREKRIGVFQKNSDYSVFLLTTQVGGVGLTLTAATRVVIFDPSWNPATDAQAVDRAYRIGQKENVVIYRLITCGTVEEKIYRRQVFKDSLIRQSTGDKKNPYRYFSMQELRELFTLEDPRTSTTQLQLQSLHASQRKTDTQLDEHIAYLYSLEIFGISDHDLMYTHETVHEDEADDEEGQKYIEHRVQKAQELVQLESQLKDQLIGNMRSTTEGAWLREMELSTQPKKKTPKPSQNLVPSTSVEPTSDEVVTIITDEAEDDDNNKNVDKGDDNAPSIYQADSNLVLQDSEGLLQGEKEIVSRDEIKDEGIQWRLDSHCSSASHSWAVENEGNGSLQARKDIMGSVLLDGSERLSDDLMDNSEDSFQYKKKPFRRIVSSDEEEQYDLDDEKDDNDNGDCYFVNVSHNMKSDEFVNLATAKEEDDDDDDDDRFFGYKKKPVRRIVSYDEEEEYDLVTNDEMDDNNNEANGDGDIVNASSKMASLIITDVDDEQMLQNISNMDVSLSKNEECKSARLQEYGQEHDQRTMSPSPQANSFSDKENCHPELKMVSQDPFPQVVNSEQMLSDKSNMDISLSKNEECKSGQLQEYEHKQNLKGMLSFLIASLSKKEKFSPKSQTISCDLCAAMNIKFKDVHVGPLQQPSESVSGDEKQVINTELPLHVVRKSYEEMSLEETKDEGIQLSVNSHCSSASHSWVGEKEGNGSLQTRKDIMECVFLDGSNQLSGALMDNSEVCFQYKKPVRRIVTDDGEKPYDLVTDDNNEDKSNGNIVNVSSKMTSLVIEDLLDKQMIRDILKMISHEPLAQDVTNEQISNMDISLSKNEEFTSAQLQEYEDSQDLKSLLSCLSPLLNKEDFSLESQTFSCDLSAAANIELNDVQMEPLKQSYAYVSGDEKQVINAELSPDVVRKSYEEAYAIDEIDAEVASQPQANNISKCSIVQKCEMNEMMLENESFTAPSPDQANFNLVLEDSKDSWQVVSKEEMSVEETKDEGIQLRLHSHCGSASHSWAGEREGNGSLQRRKDIMGSMLLEGSNRLSDALTDNSEVSFGYKKKPIRRIVSGDEEEQYELVTDLYDSEHRQMSGLSIDKYQPMDLICTSTPKSNGLWADLCFSPRVKVSGRRSTASRRSIANLVMDQVEDMVEGTEFESDVPPGSSYQNNLGRERSQNYIGLASMELEEEPSGETLDSEDKSSYLYETCRSFEEVGL